MEKYYVYILLSLKDNKLYTGFTMNLKKRLQEHARGGVKSTNPLKIKRAKRLALQIPIR